MIYRRVIAVSSLISGLVAVYLHLWKMGKTGPLVCTSGPTGCEYIQHSAASEVFGVNVALIGAIGYALVFIVATAGSLDQNVDKPWPTVALLGLIWPAVAFTLYLKYEEFIVLGGFCPWCLVSALTIALCAIMITLDWKRLRALSV